jgi:hypothetical protein
MTTLLTEQSLLEPMNVVIESKPACAAFVTKSAICQEEMASVSTKWYVPRWDIKAHNIPGAEGQFEMVVSSYGENCEFTVICPKPLIPDEYKEEVSIFGPILEAVLSTPILPLPFNLRMCETYLEIYPGPFVQHVDRIIFDFTKRLGGMQTSFKWSYQFRVLPSSKEISPDK